MRSEVWDQIWISGSPWTWTFLSVCVQPQNRPTVFYVLASSFKNCDLSKKNKEKNSNHWCLLIPIILRPHPHPACLRTLQLFLITSPRKHVWPEDGGGKKFLQIIPDTAPEGVCLGALTISVMLACTGVTLETWAGHETGEGWQKQISNRYLTRHKTLPLSRACSSLVCMLARWVTLFTYNCCLLQWGVAVILKDYYIHQTIYSISKTLLLFPCKQDYHYGCCKILKSCFINSGSVKWCEYNLLHIQCINSGRVC